MVERKRRRKNKVRGERTHGQGDTKNNRGGGSRGGRGRAGANKGKLFKIGQHDPRKYRLKSGEKGKSITLGHLNDIIENLVLKGKVTKNKDEYIVDAKSGYAKILGQGNTNKKIVLKIDASKSVVTKIKAAKGKFEFAKKGAISDLDDDDFEAEESDQE